jgi:hypothetical protein
MKINNKDMQFLYKDHIMEHVPFPQKACPNPKELVNFFRTKLSKRRANKIIDHIMNCCHCAQEFEYILSILREEKVFVEKINKIIQFDTAKKALKKRFDKIHITKIKFIKPTFLKLMWKYAFVFFGVAILLLVFIIFKSSEKIEYRGEGPYKLRLIEPKEFQSSRIPLLFKWNKVKDSNYYVLELFDEKLYRVWKSDSVFENRIFLPKDISKKVGKNKTYFWMVTAFFRDGKKIESEMGEFKFVD